MGKQKLLKSTLGLGNIKTEFYIDANNKENIENLTRIIEAYAYAFDGFSKMITTSSKEAKKLSELLDIKLK